MSWPVYSSILNAYRMLGIKCVDQILQTRFAGDEFYEEKNEHQNEPIDSVQ